jgi:ABC-type Fe3+/spermidine/putrescine transport system ATPase subunit
MSYLVLDRLAKSFGSQAVLRELTLSVAQGEVLALLGPSGSGKTTALRLIAGFESPDRGRIAVSGEDVTPLPPERRRFGMVFQHYALFPHLTVAENVAFGLEAQAPKPSASEIAARVDAALLSVDLAGLGERRIGALSGGQQQRVALARALAPEPRVLLLDEPLSNLDPTLRERTRRELRRIVGRFGITTVLVTHEQEEAFHLGDRVAVLHGGVLQQVGTPEELVERPATRFVATFIGRSSTLPAILDDGGKARIALEAASGTAARSVLWEAAPSPELGDPAPGSPLALVVRPEALRLAAPDDPAALSGKVTERRYGGTASTYLVEVAPGLEVEVQAPWDEAKVDRVVGVAPRSGARPPLLFRRDGAA